MPAIRQKPRKSEMSFKPDLDAAAIVALERSSSTFA